MSCLYHSFFGPYSMDVMASTAFSVDLDSFSNPSGPLINHAGKLFRISPLLFVFQGTTLHFHATSLSLYQYNPLWFITVLPPFLFQPVFPSVFLSWSYWVPPSSLSLQLIFVEHFWKRSEKIATGIHIRFGGENTQHKKDDIMYIMMW